MKVNTARIILHILEDLGNHIPRTSWAVHLLPPYLVKFVVNLPYFKCNRDAMPFILNFNLKIIHLYKNIPHEYTLQKGTIA